MGRSATAKKKKSTKSPASDAGKANEPGLMSPVRTVRSRVCADQCVTAIGEEEVPVFLCLRSSYNHVREVGGMLKFVRLAVKIFMQNDRDFAEIILL